MKLNLPFTEEDVNILATLVINQVESKITKSIQDSLYDLISRYVYEHFLNAESKIEDHLINQISDYYIKNPEKYQFKEFRKKMLLENLNALTSALNSELMEQYKTLDERYKDLESRYNQCQKFHHF